MMELQFNDKGARFNEDKTHRIALWRIWDKSLPMIAFVGLNPSVADSDKDDPTIRRVVGFAKNWGYGGVYMLNLFTKISTDPKALLDKSTWGDWLTDRDYILSYTTHCAEVVFAWGNYKDAQSRGNLLSREIPRAICLEKNKNGSPKHPLYCKSEIQPFIFTAKNKSDGTEG